MPEDLGGYDDDMTMLVADRVLSTVTEEEWNEFEPPGPYRAEIIRGELVVTPAPATPHGRVQRTLTGAFHRLVPGELEVFVGQEWRLVVKGMVAMAPVPDLIVVPLGTDQVVGAPLLAVEILSRSDRRRLESGVRRIEGKRSDYAAHGLADYLEIDLTTAVPTAIRYELHDGVLVEVDRAEGDKRLTAARPFAYELVPAELIRP
jgi:Uma2 family endonuclease